jgi:hypothetical protein
MGNITTMFVFLGGFKQQKHGVKLMGVPIKQVIFRDFITLLGFNQHGGKPTIYPLVNIQKTIERSTISHREKSLFQW